MERLKKRKNRCYSVADKSLTSDENLKEIEDLVGDTTSKQLNKIEEGEEEKEKGDDFETLTNFI